MFVMCYLVIFRPSVCMPMCPWSGISCVIVNGDGGAENRNGNILINRTKSTKQNIENNTKDVNCRTIFFFFFAKGKPGGGWCGSVVGVMDVCIKIYKRNNNREFESTLFAVVNCE